jgi:hypothetical protein
MNLRMEPTASAVNVHSGTAPKTAARVRAVDGGHNQHHRQEGRGRGDRRET